MLADNLNRIVAKMSKELVRALRETNHKELLALLPGLAKQFHLKPPAPRGRSPKNATKVPPKVALKSKAPKAKAKAKAEKSSVPASQRKRGAGSLTRQILKLLEVRREGFRFEEIQRRFKADPVELRETLATLLGSDRIVRNGQARGTRYSLPQGDSSESESFSDDFEAPAAEKAEAPQPPPAPVAVTDAMIDALRLALLNSSAPASLPELQQTTSLSVDELKAALAEMQKQQLVERVRSGPSPRFQLNSAPKKGPDGPRVVRKPPAATKSGETPDKSDEPADLPPEAAPEPPAP